MSAMPAKILLTSENKGVHPRQESGCQTQHANSKTDGSFGRIALLFASAFVLRLLLLPVFWNQPLNIVDEQHYQKLSQSILEKHEFALLPHEPTAIRPPAYPAFLASVYALAGEGNANMVRVAQIMLNLLTAGILFLLFRHVSSKETAFLGTAIFLFYPSLIFFDYLILSETVFIFLFSITILALVYGVDRPSAPILACAGSAIALASLTRSITYSLAIPLAALLVPLQPGRRVKAVGRVLIFLLFFSLGLTPWVVRNYKCFNAFVPVDTMGGLNLSMGNYEFTPLHRAWAAVSVKGHENWGDIYQNEMAGLNEAQKQATAIRLAREYMLEHPVLTVKRSIIKAANFWGLERTIIAGMQQQFFPKLDSIYFKILFPPIILLAYIGVTLLGFIGLACKLFLERNNLDYIAAFFILGFFGLHSIVFGHSRYHLPLVPLLCFYSAWSICNLKYIWKTHQKLVVSLSSAIVIIFGVAWIYDIFIGSIENINKFILKL